MKNKAQFEIIGLAIIVIIVMVGIFFLISFGLEPENNLAGEFQQEQFAQNVLDALMKTNLEGCSGTISDLVAYAFTDEYPTNAPVGSECERNTGALSDRLEVINLLLEDSIIIYVGKSAKISIESDHCPAGIPQPCAVDYIINDCNPRRDGSYAAGHQVISLYPYGNANIRLNICKS